MNYDALASEIVRALRGERSQSALNRKLGFRGNQVQRWEAGTRKVSWLDFLKLCEASSVDLTRHMVRFLSGACDPADTAVLVERIIGGATLADLARETGISRFALARWMQGKSVPNLSDMLCLIQACQYVVFEFLAGFVDLKSLPSAKAEWDERQKRKQVYYRRPVVAAVLCVLRLDEYKALPKHEPGYIARKVGLAPEEEQDVIAELRAVGKITWNGTHFVSIEEHLELTDSKDFRTFVAYWLRRALDYTLSLPNPHPVLGFGMEIHPTSAATLRKLREEYLVFYGRVRALLAQDHGPRDRVYVFNSLFFDLDRGARMEQEEAAARDAQRSSEHRVSPLRPSVDPVIPYSP
jgi:transcriptional regulator with XRE-family HTH domain